MAGVFAELAEGRRPSVADTAAIVLKFKQAYDALRDYVDWLVADARLRPDPLFGGYLRLSDLMLDTVLATEGDRGLLARVNQLTDALERTAAFKSGTKRGASRAHKSAIVVAQTKEGKSQQDIAEAAGCTTRWVQVLKKRALECGDLP